MQRSQLIPFIKNAEATIIPSQIDNFPNTALEAMQYEKIVFASNRASLESLIKDGVNGYICRLDDSDDYMSRIITYFSLDSHIRKEMSIQAQHATQPHSLHIATQCLIQYFEQIPSK